MYFDIPGFPDSQDSTVRYPWRCWDVLEKATRKENCSRIRMQNFSWATKTLQTRKRKTSSCRQTRMHLFAKKGLIENEDPHKYSKKFWTGPFEQTHPFGPKNQDGSPRAGARVKRLQNRPFYARSRGLFKRSCSKFLRNIHNMSIPGFLDILTYPPNIFQQYITRTHDSRSPQLLAGSNAK